jgi:DNA-directed RNA polymerase subunit F
MIAAETEAPSTPKAERPKKIKGLTPRTEAAVRQVFERIRNRLPPDYKTVATEHHVSPRALCQAVYGVRKGKLRLGPVRTLEELAQIRLMEAEKAREEMSKIEQLLREDIAEQRALIQKAKPGRKRFENWAPHGLREMLSELGRVKGLVDKYRLTEAQIKREMAKFRDTQEVVETAKAQVAEQDRSDGLTDEERAMRELEAEMGDGGAETGAAA